MLTRDELICSRNSTPVIHGWRGWVSPSGQKISADYTDDDGLPHNETAADILGVSTDDDGEDYEEQLERRGWVRVVGDGVYSVHSVGVAHDSLIELVAALPDYHPVEVESRVGPCYRTDRDDFLDRLGVDV